MGSSREQQVRTEIVVAWRCLFICRWLWLACSTRKMINADFAVAIAVKVRKNSRKVGARSQGRRYGDGIALRVKAAYGSMVRVE